MTNEMIRAQIDAIQERYNELRRQQETQYTDKRSREYKQLTEGMDTLQAMKVALLWSAGIISKPPLDVIPVCKWVSK